MLPADIRRRRPRLMLPKYPYDLLLAELASLLTILDHEGIELAGTVDAEVEAAERAQQIVNGGSMNEASASRGG